MERTYATPLLDKLGIRPGSRVAIAGLDDDAVIAEIRGRTVDVTIGEPLTETDVVLLAADSVDELGALSRMRPSLRPDGAIWVISRKGPGARLRDVEIMEAARAAGMVDNKVAAFSATHTALRLVIPRRLRPGA